jgi:hypothetical protein
MMNDLRIGVWIDHTKAVITDGQHTATTVQSEVPPHTRFSGGGGYPGGDSPQRGTSERRYEERFANDLDRYLDQVISAIGRPTNLLIFGPGEAKHELARRIHATTGTSQIHIELATADKLTDAQVIARVATHFGSPPAR